MHALQKDILSFSFGLLMSCALPSSSTFMFKWWLSFSLFYASVIHQGYILPWLMLQKIEHRFLDCSHLGYNVGHNLISWMCYSCYKATKVQCRFHRWGASSFLLVLQCSTTNNIARDARRTKVPCTFWWNFYLLRVCYCCSQIYLLFLGKKHDIHIVSTITTNLL